MDTQNAFLLAAQHRQDTMRRSLGKQLLSLVVDTILLVLVNLVGNQTGGNAAVSQERATQTSADAGILADELRDNVTSTGQSLLGIRDTFFLADVLGGLALQIDRTLGQQQLGQRLQPLLHSHRSASLALGTIRQVEILQNAHRIGLFNLFTQLRREFALLTDRIQNGGATFVQLQPFVVQIFDIPYLYFVQRAGGLLTVTRDERNRGSCLQQVQRVPHLLFRKIQFLRNP